MTVEANMLTVDIYYIARFLQKLLFDKGVVS